MFSENGKISLHQLKCLFFLDWAGKMTLLLPQTCNMLQGWNYLAAIVLGCVWMYLFAHVIAAVSGQIQDNFTNYIAERMGKYTADITGILFLIYLIWNQNYLAWMTARICHVFLLPEISEYLLGILFLTAGLMTAVPDGQVRGRCAQFLWIPVGLLLSLMLLAGARGIQSENYLLSREFTPIQVLHRSGRVFGGLMAVIFVLYETPYISWKDEKRGKALRSCIRLPVLFLLAAFFIAVGVFGTKGISRLSWPIITLMNSAQAPGVFLQRWDAVFLAFLLFSLFVAAGTGSHYMERITGEIFSGKDNRRMLVICFGISAVLFFATGNFEMASRMYLKIAVCGLIPIMVLIPILLLIIEKGKSRGAGK
ncbi:MAG: GerAB/ArcD/ProY family transporter [Eubacteriales bacterium]|nr:GerAB/ArcD/ProY family transporter [Eubacteriales bacterium]